MTETRKKNEYISLKLDSKTKRRISQEAKELGVSLSEYVRLTLGKRGVSKIRMPDGANYDIMDLLRAELFVVEDKAAKVTEKTKQGGPTGS